ncbi:FkbM family methyltransferase [Glaciecola siphonariae]|uniref:FkbM family methyltransferase n=1 Tax=Glaciecola siphonariae TaxID=521012 RepID=A0ABV9LYX4_9ALTE
MSQHVSHIFVLSLPTDVVRREHVRTHFQINELYNYSFVDAIAHDAIEVQEAYLNGQVQTYPDCFRCGKHDCNCTNNILIPQQIANWLSFKKIWKIVANLDTPVMICEDDVYFYNGGLKLLSNQLHELPSLKSQSPTLIRLGHSGRQTDIDLSTTNKLDFVSAVVMSNVAHIINPSFAKLLLKEFNQIKTTSDIWVHNEIGKRTDVVALTTSPEIATDLSFNKKYAKFPSQIHPKGIDEADITRAKNHIKRVDSDIEYHQTLETWLGSKEAVKKCYTSSVFQALKDKQISLIKKQSPAQPKRQLNSQLQQSIEQEYGFKNTYENWLSVDKDGSPIPWMTYSAIFYLQQLDLRDCSIFEWGSGQSSLFFAQHSYKVISIESNPEWYEHINDEKLKNQTVLLKSPTDYCECINEMNEKFDVISIDGDIFRRLECAVFALSYLKEGGIILLDNSDWLPNTTEFLRSSGFTQVDFAGPGPINSYLWCTSIFFKGSISIKHKQQASPGFLAAGIKQIRDQSIKLTPASQPTREKLFNENYAHFKKSILPSFTDVFASQEGEDVLLRRILKHHYMSAGLYVDVGAHHPVRFSNTYHYYLKGWHGINIDPTPNMKSLFDEVRPKDINLQLGVSDQETSLVYYHFKEPAFNTFDESGVDYALTRTQLISKTKVQVVKLSSILDKYLEHNQNITFFSIDVEGLELKVLNSNNWTKYRPLVIIVEALTNEQLKEIEMFLEHHQYIRVASTKNSYFFCELSFWDKVK